ncbi:MAG: non-homologous end-joining DNA ligase [Actinomycetota bacterium]|nr:non-homologous end-joining DNA ligase [Actinomycetota bacterium]
MATDTAMVEVDGRHVRVTNAGKVLWPQAGFTKADMIGYYLEIAPMLLPHIAGRPVTLKRAPNGVEEWYWFQNTCPHPPEWVSTRRIEAATRAGKSYDYCVINDAASLTWVANLGAIELHPLLSLTGRDDEAHMVVFDLDPGYPAGLTDCCRVALRLHDVLEQRRVVPVVKTSGLAGMHVYGLLTSPRTFSETRELARSIAVDLTEALPGLVVTTKTRAKRQGKVLVDWSQNSPLRSMVAPYSLRAAAIPTVSTPLAWDEVESADARGAADFLVFSPSKAIVRATTLGDLFQPLDPSPQLPSA